MSDDQREFYHAEVDEAVRWVTFLTGLLVREAVTFVSDKHNVNEEEYQRAWSKAVKSHELYKTITCANLPQLTTSLMKESEIRELTDAAFRKHVEASFTHDSFFASFDFMDDYLSYEAFSALGKWYANSFWTTLIVR